MKTFQLACAGTLLAALATAGSSQASEEIRTPHQACRAHVASRLTADSTSSVLTAEDVVWCPIIRMTMSTTFSTVDLRTSSGVEVGEVLLREVDQDGDGVWNYSPSTTTCSFGHHCHHWDNITPMQTDSAFFIRIDGQPNDKVYSYSARDASITLN